MATSRRIIVHPKPPALTELLAMDIMNRPIPGFHAELQAYLQGLPKYSKIYYQTYTFGPYDPDRSVRGSVNGWCWHASCRCGVNYNGDALYVKKRMRAHIKVVGHNPGSQYEIPGREDWAKARAKKKAAAGK